MDWVESVEKKKSEPSAERKVPSTSLVYGMAESRALKQDMDFSSL